MPDDRADDNDIMTVREAAEFLKITPTTVYVLVRKGKLPHKKIGGSIRFSKHLLHEWVEKGDKKAEPK